MDVALLSISIKEIILEKDSVGVPGVGTFIAELVPSTFSDKGYTINPPYRRLSFTRKATEDGLLAEREAAYRRIAELENQVDQIMGEPGIFTFPEPPLPVAGFTSKVQPPKKPVPPKPAPTKPAAADKPAETPEAKGNN